VDDPYGRTVPANKVRAEDGNERVGRMWERIAKHRRVLGVGSFASMPKLQRSYWIEVCCWIGNAHGAWVWWEEWKEKEE